VGRRARLKGLSAKPQLALDYFDAPAQLFHLSLKGAGLPELASGPGQAEGGLDDNVPDHSLKTSPNGGGHVSHDAGYVGMLNAGPRADR